jgi:hypothetical protein
MTSGAQSRGDRFIDVSWGFHGVLSSTRVFWTPRWMTLEKVPRDTTLLCWLCLDVKSSHMEVDVAGLPCPFHCPMACIRQTTGQGFL